MSTPLHLTISPGDDAPIYRQIVRQMKEAVAGGRLCPGDLVPSHRKLAQQLVVAPLTIKKAYDELERVGLLETVRGRGTFVAAGARTGTRKQSKKELRALARRLVHEAHLAGLGPAETAALIAEEQVRLTKQQVAMKRRDRRA